MKSKGSVILIFFFFYASAASAFEELKPLHSPWLILPRLTVFDNGNQTYMQCRYLYKKLLCNLHVDTLKFNHGTKITYRQICPVTLPKLDFPSTENENAKYALLYPIQDKVILLWPEREIKNTTGDKVDYIDYSRIYMQSHIYIIDIESCEKSTVAELTRPLRSAIYVVPHVQDRLFEVLYVNPNGCDDGHWLNDICSEIYHLDKRQPHTSRSFLKKFNEATKSLGTSNDSFWTPYGSKWDGYFFISAGPVSATFSATLYYLNTHDDQSEVRSIKVQDNFAYGKTCAHESLGYFYTLKNGEKAVGYKLFNKRLEAVHDSKINLAYETEWLQMFIIGPGELLILSTENFWGYSHRLWRVDATGKVSKPLVLEGMTPKDNTGHRLIMTSINLIDNHICFTQWVTERISFAVDTVKTCINKTDLYNYE